MAVLQAMVGSVPDLINSTAKKLGIKMNVRNINIKCKIRDSQTEYIKAAHSVC